MGDLEKVVQHYWTESIAKSKDNAGSLKFFKSNLYRALEVGFMTLFNPKTEQMDLPLYETPVTKAENSFDEEIMALTDVKPTHDFDFISANQSKIMGYIDIPNECAIVQKEDMKQEEELEENVSEGVHPILIPPAPICRSHIILPLNCEQSLSQELSDDILTIVLQVFSTTSNNSLKIGYNGIEAGNSLDHLHFHLLFGDDLYKMAPESGNTEGVFPIEMSDKLPFYETSLKHKKEDEVDMYTIGVIFMETFSFAVPSIILQPMEAITKDNIDQAQESLSHVCSAVTDILSAQNIGYNLLITDRGMTFYIIPRRKDAEIHDSLFNLGVFDLCGAFYTTKKEFFEKLNFKDFFEYCRKNVGLKKEEFEGVKSAIVKKLESEYKGGSS